MELKVTVGIVVVIVVMLLMFTAGSKHDYKKRRNLLPLCIPIPFTGHEICIRPYTPKSTKKIPKRRAKPVPQKPVVEVKEKEFKGSGTLKRLKNKHQQYHSSNIRGRKHNQLHDKIAEEKTRDKLSNQVYDKIAEETRRAKLRMNMRFRR